MRKAVLILNMIFALSLLTTNIGYCEGDIYYARCNLKVIKGLKITWVNWQGAPTFMPANAKLRVIKAGDKASLVDVNTESVYLLDIGAQGDIFLEKFVTKNPVPINMFTPEVQSNIQKTVARIGMTKEQVYIAMGPPAVVIAGKTYNMTYEQIMSSDLWVYKRRRFGKNIGVAFDPGSGRVNHTEGMGR